MDYNLIAPELILCAVGLLVLLGEVTLSGAGKKLLLPLAVLGLVVTLGWTLRLAGQNQNILGGMFAADDFACYFKTAILLATLLVAFIYHPHKELKGVYPGEFLSLLLFAALAMMFMASATDFLMIFLATEFASIVSYILVGFLRRDLKSNEAAVKYFLVGSFCAAIMLYGISLVYGLTGSTHISVVGDVVGGELEHGLLLTIAVFCILAGLGFKVAMAPFHFWAPDAFEGAPTPVTAFISAAPKAAGLAVLLRVFCVALPLADVNAQTALAVLSAVTMTVGNLMAIPQNNVKRLFAYSSIAHIGYILIGLVVADQIGLEGVLIYVLAYVFMNLGAFACVIAISNRIGSDDITDYGGISERSMPLALIFIVFLLSLAGLPPTAGFVGKFVVIAAAIKTGYVWLACIAIMNSVISVYYYFRIAYYMYFKPAKETTALEVGESLKFALTVTLGMTLLIGILPSRFLSNARAAVRSAVSSQPAAPPLDIKTIQALDTKGMVDR